MFAAFELRNGALSAFPWHCCFRGWRTRLTEHRLGLRPNTSQYSPAPSRDISLLRSLLLGASQWNACLEAWTRPFLLQISSEGSSSERPLTFHTMGGNVAAVLSWNCESPIADLPEAVLAAIRSSGFECPFEPLRVSNLRLLKKDGALLEVGPDAPGLDEQLASQ